MRLLLRLLPSLFAFLLLGAHFLRDNNTFMLALVLLLPFILFWRHRLSLRLMQTALVLGAIEWLYTGMEIASYRIAVGQDWLRLSIIFTALILFTLSSAFILNRRFVLHRYPLRLCPNES